MERVQTYIHQGQAEYKQAQQAVLDTDAQLDAANTGRTITLQTFNPFVAATTDIYAIGVTAPYAGRSRWVQVAQSNTAAQAAAIIQAALTA
mgnify:CR=1 FL=1